MTKNQVLSILKNENNYISGEEISKKLKVSRAAINIAVKALKNDGYIIQSSTNKGYLLVSSPDILTTGEIASYFPNDLERINTIECHNTINSTNIRAKELGNAGAPSGYAVIANEQTAGRGRRGKTFISPAETGIYLSYLLRPNCSTSEVTNITAWSAIAVANAIANVCNVSPDIKWVNDVLINNLKVCGILTELSVETETDTVSYVVFGIGINVNQDLSDFPAELQGIAGSIKSAIGSSIHRAELAAELIKELDKLKASFPNGKEAYLNEYKKRCITVGKKIKIISHNNERTGTALDINNRFELIVKCNDNQSIETISSGDVSVRGLYNYT